MSAIDTDAYLDKLAADVVAVPFNRFVGVRIQRLEPGHAEVRLPVRDELTNHIGTVHAIAELAPAELAGGLAIMSRLADLDGRVVLVARGMQLRYTRRAEGDLVATSVCSDAQEADIRRALEADGKARFDLDVVVRDPDAEPVCELTIGYHLSPLRTS